jgi:hypothetical protein
MLWIRPARLASIPEIKQNARVLLWESRSFNSVLLSSPLQMFFRKHVDVGEPKWKCPGEFLIGIEKRHVFVLGKPPGPIESFSWIRGSDPLIERCGNHSNRVSGFRLFANYDQGIGAVAFAWSAEVLDLVHRRLIQVQVLSQCGRVSGLLTDNFSAGILYDSRSMNSRF